MFNASLLDIYILMTDRNTPKCETNLVDTLYLNRIEYNTILGAINEGKKKKEITTSTFS